MLTVPRAMASQTVSNSSLVATSGISRILSAKLFCGDAHLDVPHRISVLGAPAPRIAQAITPVLRRPYIHGGYMALTHALVLAPAWMTLQQRLTPVVHQKLVDLLSCGPLALMLPRAMAITENTPVVAAFGTLRARAVLPIEWDIWLDPSDPSSLTKARIIHGNLAAETLAYADRAGAKNLLAGPIAGSDVHEGMTVASFLEAYRAALCLGGRPDLAEAAIKVMLDVKSTYSTAADIDAFAVACKKESVQVVGAGTFLYDQLEGLTESAPVWLFDRPEELISAQADGLIPLNAKAMFNGGFLLTPADEGAWAIDEILIGKLADVQAKYPLAVSVYIQETRAEVGALDVLTRCINDRNDLFRDGFAYGGESGWAQAAIARGRGAEMLYAGQ